MTPTLRAFRKWAQAAPVGSEFVYAIPGMPRDESAFEYALRLNEAGLAFLFQRRILPGRFEHVARRVERNSIKVLDNLSVATYVEPPSKHRHEGKSRYRALDVFDTQP